ncbi:hypothetical protein PybrP1_009452 [[Pythium] brassicae (nom. inval.)]|nr:hypothetical protein PybrP1_009452 [[Pythium] brassicae (nom. inval.)]
MAPTAGTRLRFKAAKSRKPHAIKKLPSLKNRIRALERFLQRGGIDDATRAAKQQELQQLRSEHEKKATTEQEKSIAEKYKKFRFVERVKLMRKLKQAKSALDQASSKAEKKQCERDFERQRQELMYVFYFPKGEPYISLFPSSPHDDAKLQRQSELRAAAIARFEKEQPLDAFHHFCYNDGKATTTRSLASVSASAVGASAAELLLKKPSKEEQKKKSKKPQSKKDKRAKKTAPVVLADQDDAAAASAAGSDREQRDDEDERDDFFL